MKLTELIAKLQKMVAENGDCGIWLDDSVYGADVGITFADIDVSEYFSTDEH